MLEIRKKLKKWLSKEWDYEILCNVFDGLDTTEIKKLADLYKIDNTKSRIDICKEISAILYQKKKEYEGIIMSGTCNNQFDPFSLVDISEIDPRKILSIEQEGKIYCFDIEGLFKQIEGGNFLNPFNRHTYSADQIQCIKDNYTKYRALKGNRFDEDEYETDTNLTALVSSLLNVFKYTSGNKNFIDASRHDLNLFIRDIAPYVSFPEISPEINTKGKDTKLIDHKFKLVRKLLQIQENFAVSRIWTDHFHHFGMIKKAILSSNIKDLADLLSSTTIDFHNHAMEFALRQNSVGFNIYFHLINEGAYVSPYYVIEHKDLSLMRFLYEIDNSFFDGDTLDVAVKTGDLSKIVWLINYTNANFGPNSLKYAIKYNHLHLIDSLEHEDDIKNKQFMSIALSNGHANMADLLYKRGYETVLPLSMAIYYRPNGDLVNQSNLITWVLTNIDNINYIDAIVTCALVGEIQLLKRWIGFFPKDKIDVLICISAYKGHLEIIEWLYSIGYSKADNAIGCAAITGKTDIVEWLHNKGYNVSRFSLDWSLTFGNKKTVVWLANNTNLSCNSLVYMMNFDEDIRELLKDRVYMELDFHSNKTIAVATTDNLGDIQKELEYNPSTIRNLYIDKEVLLF